MPYRQLAYLPDRRSTRIEQSLHITVRGLDASRAPYEENVSTLSFNCHGCNYLSRHNVLRGDCATLEVVPRGNGRPKCSASVRVVSVKRLGTREMLFDVAVELETPQEIWGLASPPEDWSEIPKPPAPLPASHSRELWIVPRPEAADTLEPKEAEVEIAPPPSSFETGRRSSLPPLLAQLAAGDRCSPSENNEQLEDQAVSAFERLIRASMQSWLNEQKS